MTSRIMNILLTMETDVCNALCNSEDIKEGIFKTGAYMGRAISEVYDVLKSVENKTESDDIENA